MKTPADFIRPSSLAAIAACPGRPTMEAAIVNAFGEPESSPEASTGTIAHAEVAARIERWKAGEGWEAILGEVDGVDKWTSWCIRGCLEFARDLISKHEIAPDNVLVEHPLDMAGVGMDKPGTADLVLVVPFQRVIVCDWKFSYLDQGDAADHDQLQAYGVAGAASFSTSEVLVYLFCPRAPKAKRASAARFDAHALKANAAWTRAVVAIASKPSPALSPSYNACLHCRALTRCAAAKEYIVQAHDALAMIGQPTDSNGWGDLASAAKIAEKFGDEAKDQVKDHLLKGGQATGWGLGSSRNIRSCTNTPEAMKRLEAQGMGALALQSITLKLGELPDEVVALIEDLVQEKPSSPSLKQIKSKA